MLKIIWHNKLLQKKANLNEIMVKTDKSVGLLQIKA